MKAVSTDQIQGQTITETQGMTRGSTVRARNFGRDIFAFLKTIVGGEISEYTIDPTDYDLTIFPPESIAPSASLPEEVKKFVTLLKGMEEGPRETAAYLNAGLIFYIAGKADTIKEGVEKAKKVLFSGAPYKTLEKWVECQNSNPEAGLKKLAKIS